MQPANAPRPCPFCSGSGSCSKCDGSGEREGRRKLLHRPHVVECWACNGSGECGLCHGTGELCERDAS